MLATDNLVLLDYFKDIDYYFPEILAFMGKLFLLIFSGWLIGEERERSNKVIGSRSIILVMLGAFMFTYISTKIGGDPARIIAQVVTGVGFIGAGMIFKHSASEILNLTTAILIWAVSAIGCMIALGFILESIVFVLTAYLILKANRLSDNEQEDN